MQDDDGEDAPDSMWTESAIFGIGTLYDGGLGDMPSLNMAAARMDESQLRLAASVFANAHDGIMITDASGVVLDINRAFTRATGFTPDEMIGKTPRRLRSGRQGAEFYAAFWDSLRQRGFWRGEIWNCHKDGHHFVVLMSISAVYDAFGSLTHYVAIYSDITPLKESQQRLEHLAYHDDLTGLPNRVMLGQRIEEAKAQALRGGQALAICFLDLDNFKPVNDLHGHQQGDRLLVEVASRLKSCLRRGDTVARFGGDEFALLLVDLDNESQVEELLGEVLERVAQPYRINDVLSQISASIGYTLFPDDNGDTDSLFRHADQAMYQAKQEGRNRFQRFDTEQALRIRSQFENVSRIRQGLARDEFELYYQPKVDLRAGRVVGAEALMRWQHPQRGLLTPASFLAPLGDDAPLLEIGDWAIGCALRQIAYWQKAGQAMSVSVNISGNHLLHPEFVSRLAAHLARYPEVDPHKLELEILETVALDDIERVIQVMGECRALGVEFALDDFGTGYSSLLYLKRLPARTLKIDQSFVRDMLDTPEGTDAITAIMHLVTAFKRRALAEGVEQVEQGIVLLRCGCDLAQGYGLSRPMAASAFMPWAQSFVPDAAWQDSLHIPWRNSDFALLAAEVEQRNWLAAVQAAVQDENVPFPAEAPNRLSGSRFGDWLKGPAANRYGHLPAWQAIPDLHRALHRLGAEIGVRWARGDQAKLAILLPQLAVRGQDLLSGLRALRLAIVPLLAQRAID
ncbi:MAG: EAL domain-containing protein [Dechloromonas sp.]|nr:EAL domain-containing protein [Dechloromonas sp.]